MKRLMLWVPILAAAGCAHDPMPARATPAVAIPRTSPPTKIVEAAPGEANAPAMTECSGASVHFDYDSAVLAAPDRDELERGSRCLKGDLSASLKIEGHTDERGTEEYNLALGDQRATVVASYLRALGVRPGQLATVSYGKERPVCSDHDEACWSRNRRADLRIGARR